MIESLLNGYSTLGVRIHHLFEEVAEEWRKNIVFFIYELPESLFLVLQEERIVFVWDRLPLENLGWCKVDPLIELGLKHLEERLIEASH